MLMNARAAARRIRPTTVSNCCTCWEFKGQEIGDRGGKEMQLMLMMLALRLTGSVTSHCCTRFKGQEIGKTCGKEIQLMLMMLAESVQSQIGDRGKDIQMSLDPSNHSVELLH